MLLATVPAGFQYADFVTGLPECTSMTFTPDGRIFYTEKSGAVRVVKDGQVLGNSVVRVSVDAYFERGLQCVTLDPDFASNGVFYLYYTKRDPDNPNTSPNNAKNRVSRFQIDPANPDRALAGSEVVVLDNIPSDSGYHNGGAMVFGGDGFMYVGTGEVGLPSINDATTRAQDLSTLAGKILRINPRAGAQLIPADNPFVGQSGKRGEIYAYGVRNPFTMNVKPGTNLIYANDVGSWQYEEINEVKKGLNYGFPHSEGYTTNSAYTSPVYAYTHASTGHSNGQAAITGGVFYTGNTFPSTYQGKYFFADYVNKFIKVFDPAVPREATGFATGANAIIDLDVGPDGNLYGLAHTVGNTNGRIVKISYVGADTNRDPEAIARADKVTGPLPLTVNFTGNGSSDPDNDPLTYSWNFGDGTTATGKDVAKTFTTKGTYTVTLTVTDGKGGSDASEPLVIRPGNEAPVISFAGPAHNSLYEGNQTITYSADATDAEDGVLDASRFDWNVVLFHQTHNHPFLSDIDGIKSGSFKVPVDVEVDFVQFYRITVTVTDAGGAQATKSIDIRPRTSSFTVASNIAGVAFTLDGQPMASGMSTLGVAGTRRRIEAPQTHTVNGQTYEFAGWSDGQGRFHDIFTPAQPTTYTATYQPAAGDPTAPSATLRPAADAYVRDAASADTNFGAAAELQLKTAAGANREIWLKFDLASVATINSAKLRLWGPLFSVPEQPTVGVFSSSDTAWAESTLTWNNRPAAGTTALSTQAIASGTQKYYEWDVTSFLQAEKAAGRNLVTLVLRSLTTTGAHLVFNGDEAAANQPLLQITP